MDEQLAAIYGTGQQDYVDESDLEKTAAAELLVKLAEEQGVDLNDFSDVEVAGMLDELYGGGIFHYAQEGEATGEEAMTEEEKKKKEEEDAKEKVAEADYLGRIMAHSMVQELNNIEKEAAAPAWLGKAVDAVKGGGSKALGAVRGYPSNVAGRGREAKRMMTEAVTRKGSVGTGKMGVRDQINSALGAGKAIAPEAGAVAGLAGLGVGGYKLNKYRKEKEKGASAIQALAEERAYELAKEAGYIDDDYVSKEASALDYEVERRALEICEANGIPVEWNE